MCSKQISRYDIQQTDSGPAIIYRSDYTVLDSWKQNRRTEQQQIQKNIQRRYREEQIEKNREEQIELNINNDKTPETKKLISVSLDT